MFPSVAQVLIKSLIHMFEANLRQKKSNISYQSFCQECLGSVERVAEDPMYGSGGESPEARAFAMNYPDKICLTPRIAGEFFICLIFPYFNLHFSLEIPESAPFSQDPGIYT